MSVSIIEAARSGDLVSARALLDAGTDVHARDENEWTPLNWAAGRGDLEMVKLLVDRGADVYRVGRDQRTPYLIALAAGHAPVARFLRAVEAGTGDASQSSLREKSYCKAYYLRDLRRWPEWQQRSTLPSSATQSSTDVPDETVVFIHQDFTVTQSMWHEEEVLMAQVTESWRRFCENELAFFVPDDIDVIESEQRASKAETLATESPEARP